MTYRLLPWFRHRAASDPSSSDLKTLLMLGGCLDGRPSLLCATLQDRLIRILLKIRHKDGTLARLSPNRAQLDFSRKAGKRSIILKAQQMGITTWIAARFFIATITRRGMLTVLVAHDQDSAEYIFKIVHRFWENLPQRLRAGALKTSRANVRQLVFPELDSEYRVESAADPGAGRGLTIQNLHCSEVARWPGDAAATLASLRAALTPRGEVVLESTPLGAVGCFYSEWQRARETGYTQHFYPWWWEAKYREGQSFPLDDLTEEECKLKSEHGLDDSQIVFRRQTVASLRGLARQEYAEDAETCFLRSGECFFDADQVERRLAECVQQPATHELTRWCGPQQGREYIIGADSAGGGVDGDYACAQVIDRESGLQCAELRAHLPPQEFSARLAALGREYNHAQIAVERNGQGAEVLSCLWNVEQYAPVFGHGGKEGLLTTIRSRSELIAALASAFYANPEAFQSDRLLREMRTFIRRKDGSGGAAPGAHDDCVMAVGVALRVRQMLAGKAAPEAEISENRNFFIPGRETQVS